VKSSEAIQMFNGLKLSVAVLGFGAAALSGGAIAQQASMKDAPAPAADAREFKATFNIGGTTDYIFRGFSQSKRNPALQAGADLTYGIAYAGLWISSVNFNTATDPYFGKPFKAHSELDLYAGIKPVLKTGFGDYNFDFGGIYYVYPGATDPRAELNYFEFKAGVNRDLWKDANISTTLFFSPNYQLETGKVWTSETAFTQGFAAIGKFVPSFSATLGYQRGEDTGYRVAFGNGDKSYVYGNAGVTLTYDEKISLDLRYWDTNLKNDNVSGGGTTSFCTGTVFQCSQRVVATVKVTF
jgi:uncharacterized protein (TIGR02001 family)